MAKRIIAITALFLVPLSVAAGVFFVADYLITPPPTLQFEPLEVQSTNTISFDQWQQEQRTLIKERKEEVRSEVTIFAAGDIMMARAVERKMLAKNDFSYCLNGMRKVIESADIAFANLESPIIAGRNTPDSSTVFRADPRSAESLNVAGFDIMNVANNHFGDQRQEGMTSTFELLAAQGIDFFGGGINAAEKHNPIVRQVNDVKIAFLGYGYGPDYYGMGADKAGMALMDIEQLKQDLEVATVRADVVVVTFHDGVEYVANASQHQIDFAHAAVDYGADIVIGHHPHVVQNMELYKEKYIFYSLGNFVFDQMWSEETRRGLSLMITANDQGIVDIDYYPVQIHDYCRPESAEGTVREAIMDRL
jgi:poly-gamma-glutamate synthesis protein (capsule biosynthesis protein)